MRDNKTAPLRIGALAKRCGLSRDTLRFYERQRLLKAPKRSASGYRLYREAFRQELAENLERCRHAESEACCCPVVLNLAGKGGEIRPEGENIC